MSARVPGEQSADAILERAKAESVFAEKLFRILLTAQGTAHGNDIPRPGELNAKYSALYDEIWAAAFYVVTAKKNRKKVEVS